MRIIAGIAKSRIIQSPKGLKIRPTSDRMKESIFNIIADKIINADILDLFAGTGNIGLEAISRGAASAVFIDNNKNAIQIIRDNIRLLGFQDKTEILKTDSISGLRKLGKSNRYFDIIFIDPPYLKKYEIPVLLEIAGLNLLKSEGSIILQHHRKSDLTKIIYPYHCIRQKRYGDTMISFFKIQSIG